MSLRLREQKNSKIQGNIGLTYAIHWFASNGYDVYLPLTDSQDADLVVGVNGRLFSVQVRTTYFKTPYGIYQVHLHVSGGNRSGTGKTKLFDTCQVDYLFVITDDGDRYLIPKAEITAVKSLNLGEKYDLYKVS